MLIGNPNFSDTQIYINVEYFYIDRLYIHILRRIEALSHPYQSLDAIESPHHPGDMREGVMTLALYEFLCVNRMPTLSQGMFL